MIQTDEYIRKILLETKVIACIGASTKPERPSHYVSLFLQKHGYRIIPVNPGNAGKTLFGETVYASLKEIPKDIKIDMLDIFRKSEAIPGIVAEALAERPELKTIWMQLGVQHDEAAKTVRTAGMHVIQNRCTKIELSRLIL